MEVWTWKQYWLPWWIVYTRMEAGIMQPCSSSRFPFGAFHTIDHNVLLERIWGSCELRNHFVMVPLVTLWALERPIPLGNVLGQNSPTFYLCFHVIPTSFGHWEGTFASILMGLHCDFSKYQILLTLCDTFPPTFFFWWLEFRNHSEFPRLKSNHCHRARWSWTQGKQSC